MTSVPSTLGTTGLARLRAASFILAVVTGASQLPAQLATPTVQSPGGSYRVLGFGGDTVRLFCLQLTASGNRLGHIGYNFGVPTFNQMLPASFVGGDYLVQRGANPSLVYYNFDSGGTRELRSVTLGSTVSVVANLLALAPGSTFGFYDLDSANQWIYGKAVSAGLTRLIRVSLSGAPTLQYLSAPTSQIDSVKLSPDGQTLAFLMPSPAPLQPNLVQTTPATFQGTPTPRINNAVVSDLVWLDNRFLACIHAVPATPLQRRVARVDTAATVNTVAFLTQTAPRTGGLAISSDREWLAFSTSQTVVNQGQSASTVENCVVAMRTRVGATTSPGGAFVVVDPLANRQLEGSPAIRFNPVVGLPQIAFGARPSGSTDTAIYGVDVLDDIVVTPRMEIGTTVTFSSTSSGVGSWTVFLASQRLALPVALPPSVQPILTENPIQLFQVPVAVGPVSVPVALPPDPNLRGRLYFQAAWWTGVLQLSRLSEAPIF